MSSTQPAERRIESRLLIWFGVITLALSGVLFFLYPAVRPWHDESTVEGALTSMSSDAWVAAHLSAIFALILMPLGMLALWGLSAGRRGGGLTFAATVITWVGVGLALPYYGAEDFALHAIAGQVKSGMPLDLLALVNAIRFSAVSATTFATGLVLLGAGRYSDRHLDLAYGDLAALQRCATRNRARAFDPTVLSARLGQDCARGTGWARVDLVGGRPLACAHPELQARRGRL